MRKTTLAALLLLAALAPACHSADKPAEQSATARTAAPAAAPSARLAAFFERFWDQQSRFDPLSATAQGDNRFNHRLPNDQTQAFRDSLHTFYQASLDSIAPFEGAALNENDRISYDTFVYDMRQRLAGLKLNTWMLPANQFWGLHLTLGQYGAGEGVQPFKTVRDYDNWLGRVRGYSAWTDSAIGNFRRGLRAGVVLPKALVVKMLPQLRSPDILVTDATKSLYYGPVKLMPKTFGAADRQRLTAAYERAILTELVPAHRRLADFLEREYLPRARPTSGINAVPGGPAAYQYLVGYWTTTDMTPAEIHALGLTEVARLRAEMERSKEQIGFKGTLQEFFASVKTDPKAMPFRTPNEVLAAFHTIQSTSAPYLKTMFGRTPNTPFEIRRTEAFREASASAEYNQGAPDGSRPGIFYTPIPDAKTFNVTDGMESLFLHEAIPGHHYQLSLQQENQALPKFRRFAGYGAYVEGWALYCESLGRELGLYKNPYQYVGKLNDEMLRAVRLVVDTGLHTGQLTREQAIAYMLANMPASEASDIAAVERYMAIPGQAVSYKVGQLKIMALRAKYEKQLGPRFKLSNFHDALLQDGALPLVVLERKMDAWAERQ